MRIHIIDQIVYYYTTQQENIRVYKTKLYIFSFYISLVYSHIKHCTRFYLFYTCTILYNVLLPDHSFWENCSSENSAF